METAPSPSSGLNNSNNSPYFQAPKSPSTMHQLQSKSHSNSLCKSLVILVLILVVIPLFPSQAPEFVTQRILTDSWEIIHLCLIGLAISYGLFSRKCNDTVTENNAAVNSKRDDGYDYLSGFSPLNSFFEDGFDEFRGAVAQSYANCQCLLTSEGQFIGRDRCAVHGNRNVRSLVSDNGYDSLSVSHEKKTNQEWRLRYSKGESLIVVSNGNSSTDGVSDFKPLNLPIRSLKSVARDNDEIPESENRYETEAKSSYDVETFAKKRGVIPRNLDKKFEETASLSRRSRSVRLQNEEEMMSVLKQISRSRPHSVGEFEFENLESGSFRGSKISSSPESGSSNSDDAERINNPRKIFFVSHSNGELCSNDNEGSFPVGKDQSLNSDYVLTGKSLGESEQEQAVKSSNSDMKSPALVKALSKAKSVRTIKSGRVFTNGKENKSDLEPKAEMDRSFDNPNTKPNSFHESHNEEKDSISDQELTESEEEDAENGSDKRSDARDVRKNDDDDDDRADLGSEVDRKAGEFIAKFREQIRLQKISSARKHSGLRSEQP